jgi:hypothetical protein
MQEFSSVTASSYDADSLAPLLSQKSADGWEVVSIVSAGTNIVAYLRRESDGTSHDSSTEVPAQEAATEPVSEPVSDTPASAVDEPAGWGAAPEAETAPAAEADSSIASLVAEVEATEAATDIAPEPVIAPVADEPAAATAEPAQTAAAESAVPAGWYADPSGRFELRYWDGAAWTEHVSRAGQQFTDPPVA